MLIGLLVFEERFPFRSAKGASLAILGFALP